MDETCKKVIDHLNRLQGQLNTLKSYLQEDRNCSEIVHMATSSAKSFDSLKAKIAQGIIQKEFLSNKDLSDDQDELFREIQKLIKA